MLMERGVDGVPERVKDKINPLATRQLRRGYEIGVSCNQDNLVNLAFEAQGGDIDADSHIHTLLDRCEFEVLVAERCELVAAIEELF